MFELRFFFFGVIFPGCSFQCAWTMFCTEWSFCWLLSCVLHPWYSTGRTELFFSSSVLLFGFVVFWIWGKNDVVVYLLHFHLITVAMNLLPSARQEKKPPPPKKNPLQVKCISLWPTVFVSTVLVLSDGWCAFWAYQRSVMFLHVSSVSQFKQVCFQQTNSEFVKARLKLLKAAPAFSHPNLLKFKHKMDIQMPFWQLWKS